MELVLVFDRDMLQVANDASRIFARAINQERLLTFLQWLTPTILVMQQTGFNADVGADLTSFIGAEMDILSIEGFPAEVWTDFPITITP